jgi:hypothetical protein
MISAFLVHLSHSRNSAQDARVTAGRQTAHEEDFHGSARQRSR